MAYCASAPSWSRSSPGSRTRDGIASATTSAHESERVLHQRAGGLGGVPAPAAGLDDPVADLDATVLRWAEEPDPTHHQPRVALHDQALTEGRVRAHRQAVAVEHPGDHLVALGREVRRPPRQAPPRHDGGDVLGGDRTEQQPLGDDVAQEVHFPARGRALRQRSCRPSSRRPCSGSKRRSSCQVSRSSSVDAQTPVPSPARNAAPERRGLDDLRPLDRDAELVGLQLAEQVVGRGAAVDAQRTVSAGLAASSSTTSRTSKAIASSVARTRCARVVPRVMPRIGAAGVRVPVRGAEPGQRGHEHHAAGVGHGARRCASVSAAEPTICSPSRSHCTAAPVTKIAPSSA